ncbi:hypothetical protein A3B51_00735 [Candidatus Curtissbacteria bacterium RIFCSPLOWO2_01_FULL_41_18]|uniref:Amidohydrolase-related domain-containing protein n=2 Tax=Candidatus Curtissiibacteriota TaxID=1752717 RepID=A0A1F5G0L5_9BACT|nr:MAG: hypothetical protein A2696_03015 [Candidatus Curtissbacteria bacterium RIFCSPHIGHO2_01_FULL_41_13]OGE03747.1 MAG: hypothetical protein A3B51_00735 [Candidatus Curtissbacteria bacterium RIFCSPLOWO2_01_FULL_41_18]
MSKLIKFPGLVDVHVHLREPGATQKEDFETGTQAAVAGGYTQILDMPNNTPPTTTPQTLEDKIKSAKGRIYCDLGFNFGATAGSVQYFKEVEQKVFGLKIYMSQTTGPLLVNKIDDRDLIFKSWQSQLPIMVHARDHIVESAIYLAKKYNRKIHICHVTANQLSSIEKAKKEGLSISSEVCPHHLFLTIDDVQRLGPLGIMKPPLLSKKDKQKLWQNIDKIDMISTDHAPHTLAEKYDQTSPASPSQGGPKFGVPGLETTLPLMLTAVKEGLITLERLTEMLCTNPRKIFNLPNQQNTYVLVDESPTYTISNNGLFTKCAWTPFVGLEGRGKVQKVVLRGKTIFENGKFTGKSRGQVIFPQI